VISLDYVSEPITFSRESQGSMKYLIIPEGFVKDFHFSTEEHLMVMLRVVGPDTAKVIDFFEDSEDEVYNIETVETAEGTEIDKEFILTDLYLDEGPNLSVDIDIEPPMVRVILDFLLKEI
jgi:hypothetical protein